MAKAKIQDIRNLVLCGHGSAGKTTLVDSMLFKTGVVNAQPSVDDGTSVCDFDAEEKHHKYTIEAKLVNFDYGGKHFNVIDTPGYPDFIGQTIGAMYGVDTAAIVINAQSGIEVNTRRVFDEAGKAGLGRMIVINKMDAENIDFPALVEHDPGTVGSACVLLNVPVGHGADFKGVVSTLSVPEDTAGALVDPNEIHDPLLESIIEVDERCDGAILRRDSAHRRGIVQVDRARGGRGLAGPHRLLCRPPGDRGDGVARRRGHVWAVARYAWHARPPRMASRSS